MAGPPSEQARRQANLRLLQRTCSNEIVSIENTATHVVLYEFSDNAWRKCDVEGSLFLVVTKQSSDPYQAIVLNRNSAENFIMSITPVMQLQHQDPYLIIKQPVEDTTCIRGIWFHSADERIAMNEALQMTIERVKKGHVPLATLGISTTSESNGTATTTAAAPRAASADEATAMASVLSVAAAEATNSTSTSRASPPAGVALDKKSLQLALLSLVQDDRFLDLLHSQYLRVVHARSKK
jgi:mRNA-decapping enzyme 1B